MSADQSAEYVAPFHPRRPVRFFAFRIKEQGQIWLEGTDEIVGVERDGDEWVILVKEEGAVQNLAVEHGRAQFRPEQSDGTLRSPEGGTGGQSEAWASAPESSSTGLPPGTRIDGSMRADEASQ